MRDDTPLAEWTAIRMKMRDLGHEHVSCAIGLEVRKLIYTMLEPLKPTDILDIGTYVGTSALFFALAAPRARVVTVDTVEHWKVPPRQSPHGLMVKAGVDDRVEFVRDDSVHYMSRTPRRFDFISIDGWHEDFQVAKEVPLALELLKPGGLIFMDDIQLPGTPPPPGLDYIPGPYRGLQSVEPQLFKMHHISHGPDGGEIAVAFLTKT